MDTMKKFLIYLILFILLFFWSRYMAGMAIHNTYKANENYRMLGTSPTITVSESKQTKVNGYIKGTITNNTGSYIPDTYLKVTFYNKSGEGFAVKGINLSNFANGRTVEYRLNHRYSNVERLTLEMTNEKVENTATDLDPLLDFTLTNEKAIWFVSGLIVLWYIPVRIFLLYSIRIKNIKTFLKTN